MRDRYGPTVADGDDGGDLPEIELIPVESSGKRPPRRTRRGLGRLLIVGVAGLLIGGLVLVTDDRGDPAPDPEDEEEDAEDGALPQPVALRPLGPRDGKASVGLPVTVEPAVGLEDGSRVTATGSGFVPSEQVAIVQCAIEAGRPARGGEAAGVDGCDTSRVEYANASSDGVATGEFSLSKTITTPVTGTIDCSSGPERCILAMAAMTDYDRSGAGRLTFGPAPPVPPDVPTLIVEPSVGLADAEVVHVTATGLAASTMVELAVCSIDPATCWSTAPADATAHLSTDGDGALAADVPVWRYLPGPEPRTYVDCAVSVCNLALTVDGSDAEPIYARLMFTPGGDGPVGPALALDPGEDVQPGSSVVVRGAGFDPTTTVELSFCITSDASEEAEGLCLALGEAIRPSEDGTFEVTVVVPSVEALAGDRLAEPSPTRSSAPGAGEHPCDGVSTLCVVRATLSYSEPPTTGLRPRFSPDPASIAYATAS